MKYGTIATGSQESLDTAKYILKNNGNAFDAAIAAVFTSMTSEFALTGAGGGGTLLGINNGQSPIIYDFFVDCPKITNKKNNFQKIQVDFGDTQQNFYAGEGSVAIPGTIMGLIQAHKDNGKLPLNIILEPAIDCAKNGIYLSEYQVFINSLVKPILTLTNEGKKLFNNENGFLKEGDLFSNSEFADFLLQLGKDGSDFFYRGDCAELIDKHFSEYGYITKNNLENYKVIKRKPLSFQINEHTVFTNPAPAFGGNLIKFLFEILKRSDALNADESSLIKAMMITSLARQDNCKDPNNDKEIDNLLHEEIINKYIHYYNNEDKISDLYPLSGFGSTTHTSVLDKDNNAVSITTTNGEGSGYFIPECGIMMNNMLGEEDLNPFGFHQWNTIRRLPTMISPTIITSTNNIDYVLGSGGSNRIRSANIQVILNVLIKKLSLKDAINNPRMHLEGNTLFYEPGVNIPNKKYLKNIILNPFKNKSLFFGGVNTVSSNDAIGDPRRGGVGEVY
ncbi:MAG: gamma-glutamyltransferase [Candidatus Marinimicrobia bacterium]|nr:gamma-glutamyltransferase [Candidatus Neomarinimicrobiota bacterium]